MQRRAATALLVALLLPGSAQACRCLPLPGLFEGAAKLVTARIVEVERTPFDGPQTVTLAVEETWKGRAEPRVTVELHTQSSACGFRVETGMRVAWILYPHGLATGPAYLTHSCAVPPDPAASLAQIEPLGRAYRAELDAATNVADRLAIELRAQDHEAAAEIVESLGKRPALAPRLRFLRGKFFYQTGRYDRAVDELQTVADNDEAKRLLNWARVRLGDRASLQDFELSGLEEWRAEIDLTGVDLHGKTIDRARLQRVVLRNANLRDTVFTGSYLSGWFEGADFRGADLRGLQLAPWGPLRNVDLRGARLGNWSVSFQGADLRNAVADGRDLHESTLAGAQLEGASFRNANLRGMKAGLADLADIDLRGADLRRAYLHQTDLSRVRLDGADLRFAVYGDATKFPPGFDPEAALLQKDQEKPISNARRQTVERFYGRKEAPPPKDRFHDAYHVNAVLPQGFELQRAPDELVQLLRLRTDLLGLYVVGNDLIAVDPEDRRVIDRMYNVVP